MSHRFGAPVRLAILLAVLAAPAAAQHPSRGPLTFEEGYPLQRMGYTPMLEAPDPVAPGNVRLDLWMGFSNVFERDSSATHDVYLDLERFIYTATLRYGLAADWEVGGRLTWEHTGGGFLDRFMVDFHDALALGSRFRRDYPYGDYRLTVHDADGDLRVDIPKRFFALEDVRLFAKWQAYEGDDGRSAVSLRAVARVPTANDQLGTERADAALMAMGRRPWRGWYVHGGLGFLTVRSSPELDDLMRDWTWLFYFGVERPFTDSLSGIIQYVESKHVFLPVGDSDVDNALANVVLGVAGTARNGWTWQISMQEDHPPRGPSQDFQFQLAFTKTW